MRTSIQLRFENIGLIEQLRAETLNAEQANKAKSVFLAAASHDLRQPIQAQALFFEGMRRGELTRGQRAGLEGAEAAMQASTTILNSLLDFSRIEAGVVEAQPQKFYLPPLLLRMQGEMAPQAAAKGLAYRSRAAASEVAVQSDPALVELILRNLVSNAIRYTAHGGVLVGYRLRAAALVLEVWDTGIGIEAAQQAEVFREFHQLGNPERDRDKGLGLGLAIAQGLARTLGHPLTLESRPGRGSVFRLTLPLAGASLADTGVAGVAGGNERDDPAEADAAAGTSQARCATLQGKRVLLIEDDQAVRVSLLALLHDWGCAAEGTESVESALALAARNPPDLIISDYRLRASRTGAQAIAALRAQAGRAVPALLITGDTAPERLREAVASGIPLLHKPVAPKVLHLRLLSLVEVPVVVVVASAAASSANGSASGAARGA